ncbi:helix-turn-helix domain-containing protein [Streptomyces sp. NPDC086787]|uniref:helix-turn-helix domain-containing protein n=1 Tax=Streptomyces sp. NPDC086787 TaxID=3365759 RepID=UPI00382788A3
MDTQNPSVPPHAQSRVARRNHSGGLIHDNARHTARFTVIGNHLAQHPELSGLAIGLGVYIQSLPAGARVDIKTLTTRFPEGATRIAAALRELEAHGYLRRERERLPGGRIVTRTVSCNQPGRHRRTADAPAPERSERPRKRAARKPLPAVPQPVCTAPALLQQAADLLADLRRLDPRLLLSACDTAHLAPGVAAWLERDAGPAAVRHALTTGFPPEGVRRPAALMAHRLRADLPPLPPLRAPALPPQVRHPLQTCESCDRAFRAPEPGLCRECRSARRLAP